MTRLEIENFGPIHRADLHFGDLTVFVGPQATGKSLVLQLLRLLLDAGRVVEEFDRHGLNWGKSPRQFWELYFGEGTRGLKNSSSTRVRLNGGAVNLNYPTHAVPRPTDGFFYVPAQRVLTLRSGWPRPFSDYSPGDPFVVRDYSERLRLLVERTPSAVPGYSPEASGLDPSIRDLVRQALFHRFELEIDRESPQSRLVLAGPRHGQKLPFMVWSTGQREFVPLLLCLYWLLSGDRGARQPGVDWVVIEEPEMGLHPRAVSVVLLVTLALLRAGYKVCISTHSQQVLDLVWALGLLREHGAGAEMVLELFDVDGRDKALLDLAEAALRKTPKVYAFDTRGDAHDISGLDPASADRTESSWGGLGEFSGRASDVVARAISASAIRNQ